MGISLNNPYSVYFRMVSNGFYSLSQLLGVKPVNAIFIPFYSHQKHPNCTPKKGAVGGKKPGWISPG